MTPISAYHPDNNKIFPEQSWYPSTRYHQYAQHSRKPNVSAYAQASTGCPTSFRGNMKYHARLEQLSHLTTIENDEKGKNNCDHKIQNQTKHNTSDNGGGDDINIDGSKFKFPTLERRGTVEVRFFVCVWVFRCLGVCLFVCCLLFGI